MALKRGRMNGIVRKKRERNLRREKRKSESKSTGTQTEIKWMNR